MDKISWKSWGDSRFEDFSDILSSCRNPERRIIPKREELEELAKRLDSSLDYALKVWQEEQWKIPEFLDKEKYDKILEIRDKAMVELFNHCVKNRVFVSDTYHQNGEYGMPVYDNKYAITFTLRAWAGFMAEVWNTIEGIVNKYDYLDFYCSRSVPDSYKEEDYDPKSLKV